MDRPPPRYVAVCGQSEASPHLEEVAEEVGRRLGEAGAVVLCGGLQGVMEAASRGAAGAGATVVGVLPGASREGANRYLSLAIPGLGEARNAVLAAAAEVVIAIGEGWGTLSEIAFARRLGRRVVGLQTWTVEGLELAADAAEAVQLALA